MKKFLALSIVALTLAGCGTTTRIGTGFKATPSVRALTRALIVDAPGVVVGVEQKVSGKYKIYKISGLGTVKALDESSLDVVCKLSAKVGPVTVTKNVTFQITRTTDATWPYRFLTVNTTDKETFDNKAQLVTSENGKTTFKLDDGTNSVIAADGLGAVRVQNADFDLTFGGKTALAAE